MIRSVDPYLSFPGNTEEAFTFYRSVFGGEFTSLIRFREFEGNPMGISEEELDLVAHISLPLGDDAILMGSDVASSWREGFVMGTNTYTHLEVESPEAADRLFRALSEGGKVGMPLDRTEWAEKFGDCVDRFGVRWMVSYTGSVVFPG